MTNDNLPLDHPNIKSGKTGVLIANLGTPDGTDYWSMRRYLGEFLSDPRVVDLPRWKWLPILQLIILSMRPFSSGAAYRSIWNTEADESPLLTFTKAQTHALRSRLAEEYGDQVEVDFCMRYGNPSSKSKVKRLLDLGCSRILFFPLYPQYAGATTATANDAFFAALSDIAWQPAVRTVEAYFEHPKYISALASSVRSAYAKLKHTPEVIVASYHGMPERYLQQGDPYHCQCQKTSRLLTNELGWSSDELVTSFQSIFGREEWLKPYTVETVAALARAGKKRIAVIAPAFSSDCIETLEEIEEEIRDAFINAGGEEFTYIPCLNDSEDHIAMLATLVAENTAGWLEKKA
jgi:ferrochelatase